MMNAKERFYSGLARETIGKITSSKDNWTSFLVTMSRNYEFTYPEQVMIYAQRPNATFCKPYDEWNDEKYRRYVRRGSTGIALFVTNRDKPYLRYVFDVADTGVRRSSPELKPWAVTEENRAYVMEAMERSFGVAADGLLEAQLEEIALSLSAEYWEDYKKPILDIVANSFLEEYDELNIEVAFKRAVANSVSYAMYCRLVEKPDNYFEHEDFLNVFDFVGVIPFLFKKLLNVIIVVIETSSAGCGKFVINFLNNLIIVIDNLSFVARITFKIFNFMLNILDGVLEEFFSALKYFFFILIEVLKLYLTFSISVFVRLIEPFDIGLIIFLLHCEEVLMVLIVFFELRLFFFRRIRGI